MTGAEGKLELGIPRLIIEDSAPGPSGGRVRIVENGQELVSSLRTDERVHNTVSSAATPGRPNEGWVTEVFRTWAAEQLGQCCTIAEAADDKGEDRLLVLQDGRRLPLQVTLGLGASERWKALRQVGTLVEDLTIAEAVRELADDVGRKVLKSAPADVAAMALLVDVQLTPAIATSAVATMLAEELGRRRQNQGFKLIALVGAHAQNVYAVSGAL